MAYEIDDNGDILIAKHSRVTLERGDGSHLYLKGWTMMVGGVWIQDFNPVPLTVTRVIVRNQPDNISDEVIAFNREEFETWLKSGHPTLCGGNHIGKSFCPAELEI